MGRHVCALSACLLQAPEVSSLQTLFPPTDRTVVEPTLVILDVSIIITVWPSGFDLPCRRHC